MKAELALVELVKDELVKVELVWSSSCRSSSERPKPANGVTMASIINRHSSCIAPRGMRRCVARCGTIGVA